MYGISSCGLVIDISVLASTVSTVILTVGRGKGRLEWGKQHLWMVGNRIGKP